MDTSHRWLVKEGPDRRRAVIEALVAGREWRSILVGFPGVNEVSNGLDLRGIDLSALDLRQAQLERARLDSANLRGANLNGVSLKYASFREAAMGDADLAGADLTGADFQAANLDHANLEGVAARGTRFSNASLVGVNMAHAFCLARCPIAVWIERRWRRLPHFGARRRDGAFLLLQYAVDIW